METSGLHTCVYTCALRHAHINIHTKRGIIYITGLSHSGQHHFLLLPCNCETQIISFSRTFASLGTAFNSHSCHILRTQRWSALSPLCLSPVSLPSSLVPQPHAHLHLPTRGLGQTSCTFFNVDCYISVYLPSPENQLSGHQIFNPQMTFSVTFHFFQTSLTVFSSFLSEWPLHHQFLST